ncbi:NYN domain-containing protein [Halobaculum sp. CBA1158]|uniref:NYN domain-containing protein n=1 Tax=Halobaculum sp. CBA1158 TaxID=2904243 RepID=UPI001F2EDD17|nr:NYN domain-containing protein [Halobaculum sp. CBA1158]UIP01086.1 NYN domain-containing protein [Halobaculum sp. CBA1158]
MGLFDRLLGATGDRSGEATPSATRGDARADADAAGPRGPWRDGDGSPAAPAGVALFVDGPNVFREEFDVEFADLRAAAEGSAAGDAATGGTGLVTARVYLDEHATPGLIQAAEANGFQVVTTSGDVDVKLAVDVASFAAERRAATVAVASRDTDFKPALEVANEYGLGTLAIAPGSHGRSDALRRSADDAVTLGE